MKNVLLTISLLASLNVFSQNNFNHSNSTLTWQLVFNKNISISELNIYLKSIGFNCGISGEILEFDKDFSLENLKPHGYSWGSFPTYMNNGNFHGFIEFKDDKYRVTIPSIKIIDVLDASILNELETWTYRKDKMKMPTATEKVLNMFNSYFSETFNYKSSNNDW